MFFRHSRLRNANGEISSWLLVAAFMALAASLARPEISTFIDCQVQKIVTSLDGGTTCGGSEVVDPPPGGGDDPETPPPPPAVGADGIPTEVQSCSASVTAGGGAFGIEGDVTGQVEFIVETYPDGTQVVTVAGDAGVGAGPGTGAGAYVGVGDVNVGAYAGAGASATGLVGAGVQYELGPGESVQDLIVDLVVSSAAPPGAGFLDNVLGTDLIPDPPLPDAVFGDLTSVAGASAEAIGGAANGPGILSLDARAGANVSVNSQVTVSGDALLQTQTIAGEFSAGAGGAGGIPFFAWETGGVGVSVEGAIAIEYEYDFDGNLVGVTVRTSYTADGEVDVPFGDDDGGGDLPTITTQEWTLDPSDPEILAALHEVTENPSLDGASDAWEAISDGVSTTGPVVQDISVTTVPFGAEGGALIAKLSVSGEVECVTIH